MTNPRLRFAPSPTGRLHVGNIRTALLNWLYAKAPDRPADNKQAPPVPPQGVPGNPGGAAPAIGLPAVPRLIDPAR